MSRFIIAVCLLMVGCGTKREKEYRTYRSGDKAIVFRNEDFAINDPFPIQFFSAGKAGSCKFWLSGVHDDAYNRSIEHYAISNCTGEVGAEGGTYAFDGVGFTLCANEIDCLTYRE